MNTNMPQYQLSETVGAAKIQHLTEDNDGSVKLTFTDQNIPIRTISARDLKGQIPPPNAQGWYLLEHQDGSVAFLPGPQFEKNYRHADVERKKTAAA